MRTRKQFRDDDSTAILYAATAGVLDPVDQKRLIRLSQSNTPFGIKAMRFILIGILAYFSAYLALLFVQMHDSLRHSLAMIVGTSASALLARKRANQERRYLAKKLFIKSIRPRMCLICLRDLAESIASQCPECGEPLAPPPPPEQLS